jgi:uncharacterized protein (DUF1501 family)
VKPIPRRDFLRGGLALSAAAGLPSLFARALHAAGEGDRVLVLLQFSGGNDGLNTVIPFEDDLYYRARPGLGIPKGQVVRLDGAVGLHPALSALKPHFEKGTLAVVQGVGYPEPNRSHFTSTDIWQTASLTPPARWTGWIGRALDRCAEGAETPALQLDPSPLSLALAGERTVVPAVRDAERFRVPGGAETAALMDRLAATPRGGETAEYLRGQARQAYRTAARLESALRDGKGRDRYPGSDLGQRLWQVARLVEARLPARVYALQLGGFDTHSRQRDAHQALLKLFADAAAAFQGDLEAHGLADRVMLLTYSEFGRRVAENRSLGTDHGAAAPLFALGGRVRGGVHGAHPSLQDLDDGDLRFATDFRSVYATVLDRFLSADARAVLGAAFPAVPFL